MRDACASWRREENLRAPRCARSHAAPGLRRPPARWPRLDAVEARQVRTGLGRRDDVVTRMDGSVPRQRADIDQRRQPNASSSASAASDTSVASACGRTHCGSRLQQPAAATAGRSLLAPVCRHLCACISLRQPFGAGGVAPGRQPHRRRQQRASPLALPRQRTGSLVQSWKAKPPCRSREHAIGRLDAGDAGEAGRLADQDQPAWCRCPCYAGTRARQPAAAEAEPRFGSSLPAAGLGFLSHAETGVRWPRPPGETRSPVDLRQRLLPAPPAEPSARRRRTRCHLRPHRGTTPAGNGIFPTGGGRRLAR